MQELHKIFTKTIGQSHKNHELNYEIFIYSGWFLSIKNGNCH